MPAENTSILVDMGNGNHLLISNMPQVPGGPCELTVQTVQAVPADEQQQQESTARTPMAKADHQYRSIGRNPNRSATRGTPVVQNRMTGKRTQSRSLSFNNRAMADDEWMDPDEMSSSRDGSEFNTTRRSSRKRVDEDSMPWLPDESDEEWGGRGVYSPAVRNRRPAPGSDRRRQPAQSMLASTKKADEGRPMSPAEKKR